MAQPARLTHDLLARKGEASPTGGFARPAMAWDQPLPGDGRPEPAAVARSTADARSGSAAAAALCRVLERAAPLVPPPAEPPPAGMSAADPRRVAMTLRLDRARHTRLKVYAARHRQSSQEVLLRALDALLDAGGGDCACLRTAPEP